MEFKTKSIVMFLFLSLFACPSPIFAQDLILPVDHSNPGAVNASAPIPHLPKNPGAREHVVIEPVSNGKTYIYEAGRNHRVSVLLIHGVGNEGSRVWGHLVPVLAQKYHVVTFDLPGFGRSSKKNVLYSPPFYAAYIKWVVKKYVRKRPFMVIGHSLGGAIALCHASLYPENLQRLILVDVSGVIHRQALTQHIMENNANHRNGLMKIPLKLFGKLKSKTMGAIEFHSLSDNIDKVLNSPTLRERILDANPQKIAGLALANYDFSRLIYGLNIPAIILWGENDPITPIRTGKLLSYVLNNARFQVIPDTGHNPICERPAYFNRTIQNALITRSGGPAWRTPKKTNRTAVLRGKHDLTLTGHYKYVEIANCRRIRLVNVMTESLEIFRSDVQIENTRVHGKRFALNTRASRIKLTGVQLSGETAIIASGCELDLAGVKLTGVKAAVRAINGSDLLFSVSRINSPHTKGYIHGSYEVIRGRPL